MIGRAGGALGRVGGREQPALKLPAAVSTDRVDAAPSPPADRPTDRAAAGAGAGAAGPRPRVRLSSRGIVERIRRSDRTLAPAARAPDRRRPAAARAPASARRR